VLLTEDYGVMAITMFATSPCLSNAQPSCPTCTSLERPVDSNCPERVQHSDLSLLFSYLLFPPTNPLRSDHSAFSQPLQEARATLYPGTSMVDAEDTWNRSEHRHHAATIINRVNGLLDLFNRSPSSADRLLEFLDTPRSFSQILEFIKRQHPHLRMGIVSVGAFLALMCTDSSLLNEPWLQVLLTDLRKPSTFVLHVFVLGTISEDHWPCGCAIDWLVPCRQGWCSLNSHVLYSSMPTLLNCQLGPSNPTVSFDAHAPPTATPARPASSALLQSPVGWSVANTQSSQAVQASLSQDINALLFAIEGGDLDQLQTKPAEAASGADLSLQFISELGAQWTAFESTWPSMPAPDVTAAPLGAAFAALPTLDVEEAPLDAYLEDDEADVDLGHDENLYD
jgi:hypothetical protein